MRKTAGYIVMGAFGAVTCGVPHLKPMAMVERLLWRSGRWNVPTLFPSYEQARSAARRTVRYREQRGYSELHWQIVRLTKPGKGGG